MGEKKKPSEEKGETRRHKLLVWFLKHVLLIFSISFVTVFAFTNFYELLLSMNVEELFQINLLLSSFMAVSVVMSWNMGRMFFPLYDRMFEKAMERRKITPLSQRITSRKYYLILSYCFALLGAVSLIFLVRSYPPTTSVSFISFALTIVFLELSIAYIYRYQIIVQDKEQAVFYLGKFWDRLRKAYEKKGQIPSIEDLSKGFKYYENSLASSITLKSTKEKLNQINLVLDRGSKSDHKRLMRVLKKIIDAIEKGDHNEFDIVFVELIDFLSAFENEKRDVIELGKPTRIKRGRLLLSELAKPILERVVPMLIILAIIALVYIWSGIRLTPMNP